jgi:hypothetical protein
VRRLNRDGATARLPIRQQQKGQVGSCQGKNDSSDLAVAKFTAAYADQNERDCETLVKAVKAKCVKARTGVQAQLTGPGKVDHSLYAIRRADLPISNHAASIETRPTAGKIDQTKSVQRKLQ